MGHLGLLVLVMLRGAEKCESLAFAYSWPRSLAATWKGWSALLLWIGDGDGTGHSALTPEPLEPNAVCSGESQAHLRLSQPQDAVVACAPRISGPESE